MKIRRPRSVTHQVIRQLAAWQLRLESETEHAHNEWYRLPERDRHLMISMAEGMGMRPGFTLQRQRRKMGRRIERWRP